MDKKAVIYFISSFLIISSAAVYFVLKDMYISEETYTLTGEYDIWATEYTDYAVTDVYSTAESAETRNERIDINDASEEELMSLKGIGKTLAGNIISYRESAGGFKNVEEITNVKGIGGKIFLGIKDNIYVKGADEASEDISDKRENKAETVSGE